jgi:hypothetical protein
MYLTRHENYDQVWKMRAIFGKLSDSYAKFHSPTEHLVVDEIIVLFKGSHLQTCVTKKHKRFGIKLYNLCDSKGYTYDMTVFRQRWERATPSMTATHATVTGLAARIERVGYK